MTKSYTFATTALFLSFICATASVEGTTTSTWAATTTSTGAWTDSTQWTPEDLPTTNSDVVFAPVAGANLTVTSNATLNVNSITLSTANGAGSTSVVNISGGNSFLHTLTKSLDITVEAGTLQIAPSLDELDTAYFIGPGTVTLTGTGSVSEDCNFDLSGDVTVQLNNSSGGALIANVAIASGSTLATIISSTIANPSGDGDITIASGQTLVIDQSSHTTFGGVISGAGSVYYIAIGDPPTLTLTEVNRFTGDLTIGSGGVIALSGNGAIADAYSVTDNGTLDLSASTTLSTINNFSGAGALVMGSHGLIIVQDIEGLFSGAITGSGDLTKEGEGTLTLSGSNTITSTTVSHGVLALTGALTGELFVDAGAGLSGSGRITGDVTIDTSAYLLPGDSSLSYSSASLGIVVAGTPGTITITGNLTLDTGSSLFIPVSGRVGTKASQIVVSGTADVIGSAMTIGFGADTDYSVGTKSIFTADSMSGTFSSVILDDSLTHGLNITTAANAHGRTITIETARPSLPTPRTRNGRNVLSHLTDLYTVPSLSPVFQKLALVDSIDPSGLLLEELLSDIQPACSATATFASTNAQFDAISVLSARSAAWRFSNAKKSPQKEIAQLEDELLVSNANQPFKKKAVQSPSCVLNMGRPGDRYAVWFNPFGEVTNASTAVGSEVSFDAYTGGGLVGMDACVYDAGLIEGAIGAARTSVALGSGAGHQTVNYYLAALNGTYTIDDFFIEVGVLGAYDQLESKRYINLPDAVGRTASGSHNMWQVTPQLSFGYLFWAASWGVEPFIAEDWVFNFESRNAEHGAAELDSSVAARNSSLLRSEVGVNFYNSYTFTNKAVLLFRATGGYVNEVPFNMGKMNVSFFQVETGSFEVNSFTKAQNLGTAGVEFIYGATNGMFGSLQYDGEFGQGYSANELQLQVGYSF